MQPEGINLGTMYKSYGFYGPKDFTKLYTIQGAGIAIFTIIKRKVFNNGYTVN